ncbi:diguanylate cyclase [Bacillus tianshenii]|nr:diguanylate cyclase [Bacillus tianshenii]
MLQKLNLRKLIMLLAFCSILFTLINSFITGYRVNEETLKANTLETNRVYAQRVAAIVEDFLQTSMQTLRYSAQQIPSYQNNSEQLLKEADRLKHQTNTFNSVFITDKFGLIQATSPHMEGLIGDYITSIGGNQALKLREPFISKPYEGVTGLNIFLSYPIYDKSGQFSGMVGGTIHLRETNTLDRLLGKHFYKDGSYIYVVDRNGRIIYHQQPERVNDVVTKNAVVQQVMQGNSGAQRVINTKGKDMLAGYAYIPTAQWGFVAQRPTEMALAPAKDLITKMIVKALPFFIISLIISWWLSKRISKPLFELSIQADLMHESDTPENIRKISSWYYEAIHLKDALLRGLGLIHKQMTHMKIESQTDPLTKLMNRRTMNTMLSKWEEEQTPFSVIALDIDNFKRINDTYGHAKGDEVLVFLANHLQKYAGKHDICCRMGGEEFMLFLPETSSHEAFIIAERLRKNLENTVSPCGKPITVSAGISEFPIDATSPAAVLEKADSSLYSAKRSGRNRCIIHAAENAKKLC